MNKKIVGRLIFTVLLLMALPFIVTLGGFILLMEIVYSPITVFRAALVWSKTSIPFRYCLLMECWTWWAIAENSRTRDSYNRKRDEAWNKMLSGSE